jgi:hypothetical protein
VGVGVHLVPLPPRVPLRLVVDPVASVRIVHLEVVVEQRPRLVGEEAVEPRPPLAGEEVG